MSSRACFVDAASESSDATRVRPVLCGSLSLLELSIRMISDGLRILFFCVLSVQLLKITSRRESRLGLMKLRRPAASARPDSRKVFRSGNDVHLARPRRALSLLGSLCTIPSRAKSPPYSHRTAPHPQLPSFIDILYTTSRVFHEFSLKSVPHRRRL